MCDCSQECGLQITAREVLAVLQSHRIPDVHPLREYVLNCKPWEEGHPNWIGWLAEQVTVEGYGTFVTTAEISDKLVIKGSIKKPMSLSRLSMVLQQQGFKSKRIGKAGTRGWIVRERDTDEINANRSIEGKG